MANAIYRELCLICFVLLLKNIVCESVLSLSDISLVSYVKHTELMQFQECLNQTDELATTVDIITDISLIQDVGCFENESHVANPIANLRGITELWNKKDVIQTVLEECNTTDDLSIESTALLPKEEEVYNSMDSVLHLQKVYKLETSALIRGEIGDHKFKTSLRSSDCLALADRAAETGDFYLALDWYNEASRLTDVLHEKLVALYNVAVISRQLGDTESAYDVCVEALDILSCYTNSAKAGRENNLAQFKQPLSVILHQIEAELMPTVETLSKAWTKMEVLRQTSTFTYPALEDTYMTLCRIKNFGNENLYTRKDLFCKYTTRTVPWYTFKAEVLNLSPFVSMIYDFVSDEESSTLRDIARPKLERSKVLISEKGTHYSKDRKSQQTWMSDNWNLAKKLTSRVELISGLDATTEFPVKTNKMLALGRSADLWQVANYDIGGHYNLHHDYVHNANLMPHLAQRQHVDLLGDRMLTFMIYLNTVEAGGNTVFPYLDLAVQPTKNSAVMWYNAAPSGIFDERTLHAGCPVLLGEKWIANKWIREFSNILKRKSGPTVHFLQQI